MKKNIKFIVLCSAIVLLLIFPCVLLFSGCKSPEKTNSYCLEIEYDEVSHSLKGKEEVEYVNNSNNLLKEVHFHLYPNAFRQNAKAKVVSAANAASAYPNGESYGNIEIKDVAKTQYVDGFSIGGEDENILCVNLTDGIYPDESVKIIIDFEVNLPNIHHRFGYGENTINLGNFYPIACVYEDGKGFCEDLYHSNGDPFYSDCSSFDVKITYPSNLTLACSGDKISSNEEQDKTTSIFSAQNIRDFAIVLSDKFEQISQEVDGIEVQYFYYDDTMAEKSLEIATRAMQTFNKLFGKYPYSSVSVCKANFVHGGMEFPRLVLISDAEMSYEEYEYVIVHELAHQWWYGVVGNNEYTSAWQDEGLTEYSTALFYEQNTDLGLTKSDIVKSAESGYNMFLKVYKNVGLKPDTRMERRLDEFEFEQDYVACTYNKGVILFDTFRQIVGDKKFFKALQIYYKTYSFKNPSSQEFIRCMMDSTGADLEDFFTSWINGEEIYIQQKAN